MRNRPLLSYLHAWMTETKLKPMVFFKRKTLPKENFPPGVLVHCHPKARMDEAEMKLWAEKVWRSRPGSLLRKKSLLVWDSFQAHLLDSVKWAVRQTNTDIAVIPGGLASILQPRDVSLNKPFEDRLHEQWNNWMIEGQKSFTPTGNTRAASLATLRLWVLDSWRSLPVKMVAWSFKKCGHFQFDGWHRDEILWKETEDVPTTPVDNEDEMKECMQTT